MITAASVKPCEMAWNFKFLNIATHHRSHLSLNYILISHFLVTSTTHYSASRNGTFCCSMLQIVQNVMCLFDANCWRAFSFDSFLLSAFVANMKVAGMLALKVTPNVVTSMPGKRKAFGQSMKDNTKPYRRYLELILNFEFCQRFMQYACIVLTYVSSTQQITVFWQYGTITHQTVYPAPALCKMESDECKTWHRDPFTISTSSLKHLRNGTLILPQLLRHLSANQCRIFALWELLIVMRARKHGFIVPFEVHNASLVKLVLAVSPIEKKYCSYVAVRTSHVKLSCLEIF